MLVLTGATGGVGGAAARLLALRGQPLRLLVRDAARAAKLPNSEVVQADYSDRASLVNGMRPGDIVFMVSLNPPPGQRMKLHGNFVAAAVEAQVAHVVYLSFLSAGPAAKFLHARTHWETEQLIVKSGLPHTFLRTSYYDTVTSLFFVNGVASGPGGQGAVTWVSRPDCAAAVAAVMQNPAAHRDKTYDINGPEALTLSKTSEIIASGTGMPYRYVDADFDPTARAKQWSAPEEFLTHVRSGYLGIAAGEFSTNREDLMLLTGTRGTTLAAFVAQNRGTYAVPTSPRDARE